MNIRRVNALFKKEIIHIVRDPRSLGMAFILPVILLALFGFALTLDVDNVPLAVWDQDKTAASRDFILNFNNSKYFKIVGYFDDYRTIENYIDRNKALMALIIPKDFSKDLRSVQPASVQLLVDGSDSNTASIAVGYVSNIVSRYNANLIARNLSAIGVNADPFPIDLKPRVWFNADLKSRNFIIPGLIAVIMMVIAALLTSLTVAREWERGTMEQLISTPIKSQELILGKFLPYFVIGFIDLLIAVCMGKFVFDVPLRGELSLFFALSAIYLAGTFMLGLYISIATRNQLLASQTAILATFLPAFILSGFMFAISNMPKAIQVLTYFVPARYFITVIKGIYLKAVGFDMILTETIFLSLFALLVVILAGVKFKKKVV